MRKTLLAAALVVAGIALPQAQQLPGVVVEQSSAAQRVVGRAPLSLPRTQAPARITLGDNQLIMGPYAGDAIADDGLGLPSYPETFKLGTLVPLSAVRTFAGGQVKAIRIGLCEPVEECKVFIYKVTRVSPLSVGAAVVEQDVAETEAGWNYVELDEPVTLSTVGIQGLMIGYQYKQKNTTSGGYYTSDCYPISVVEEGNTLASYCYGKVGNSTASWRDIGLSGYGNLSVQVIVESEDFPDYNLTLNSLTAPAFARVADGLQYKLKLSNVGVKTLTDYALDVLLDGEQVARLTAPAALTQAVSEVALALPLDGVEPGKHTLAVRAAQVAGQAADGQQLSTTFTAFTTSMPRQKQLVEHFTSQGCTYCPLGEAVLKALDNMRGDVAWVSIHGNMNVTDVFNFAECDQIMSYLGVNSFPTAVFNRYDAGATGELSRGLGYNSTYTQAAAQMFSAEIDSNPMPALATVSLTGDYDAATRQLTLTVGGQATEDFDLIYGRDNVALTVYLTEDSLVARQLSSGTWIAQATHNHVLRTVLTAAQGDALGWSAGGTAYANTFTTTLSDGWNADRMHVIAFVSRKGTGKEVINTELVALGELAGDAIKGDINGDGSVDIDDVNILVNILLGNDSADRYAGRADVTGSGVTDIEDINAAVNIMLAN